MGNINLSTFILKLTMNEKKNDGSQTIQVWRLTPRTRVATLAFPLLIGLRDLKERQLTERTTIKSDPLIVRRRGGGGE